MLQTLFLLLLAYVIFRFIVRFVLPIAQIVSNVQKHMKHAQQNGQPASNAVFENNRKPVEGEYIDYEELR